MEKSEPLLKKKDNISYNSDNGYAVFINSSTLNSDTETNKISTSKYQWYSFFPKMLMEQFARLANAYFLIIAILQSIKEISYSSGSPVILFPLSIVILINGLKDLFEDMKRKKSDNEENNNFCLVYDKKQRQFVNKKWKEIVLGDIVKVMNDHQFPADLILLNSSEPNGICYVETKNIDGISPIKWWSGLKHDCTKVMELTRVGNHYKNNIGETVEIENGLVYPFLKSSDIKGEEILRCRKYVIVTQHHTSDNTSYIKERFPLTFSYLHEHKEFFDSRKSTIYKNRPDFCIFGIGDYSFKKYKIVISGLYKQTKFSIVGLIDDKETMLDDTTYLLGFEDKFLAVTTLKILNSKLVQEFIRSVFFEDSKRPISKELLMRIDLIKALNLLGNKRLGLSEDEYYEYKNKICPQPELNLLW